MAEFEITIQKKELLLLGIFAVFLVGVGYVIAYNSGAPPNVMGHSIGEMDWSQPIPSDVSVDGALRLIPRSSATCNAANNGRIYYDSDNDELYTCQNGVWNQFKGPQGIQGIQG